MDVVDMNVDIRNRGLTAYIQGQNAVGTSIFLNRLHRAGSGCSGAYPARGLEVYVEAVLDLPGVPDQTARCTKARLQILRTNDVVRRAAGSIEGMARA